MPNHVRWLMRYIAGEMVDAPLRTRAFGGFAMGTVCGILALIIWVAVGVVRFDADVTSLPWLSMAKVLFGFVALWAGLELLPRRIRRPLHVQRVIDQQNPPSESN